MHLVTPIPSALQSNLSDMGLTVEPSDAQTYIDFTTGPFWSSDGKYMLYYGGPSNTQASPIYADKNVTANGEFNSNTFNMSLKKGWNYMIFYGSTITASQEPISGFSWKLEESK